MYICFSITYCSWLSIRKFIRRVLPATCPLLPLLLQCVVYPQCFFPRILTPFSQHADLTQSSVVCALFLSMPFTDCHEYGTQASALQEGSYALPAQFDFSLPGQPPPPHLDTLRPSPFGHITPQIVPPQPLSPIISAFSQTNTPVSFC